MITSPSQDVHEHAAWTMLPSGGYVVAIGLVLVLAMVAGLRQRGHSDVDEYHLKTRYWSELRVWGMALSATYASFGDQVPSTTRADYLRFVSTLPNPARRELWVTTSHWDERERACGGTSMAELLEMYHERSTSGEARQAVEE